MYDISEPSPVERAGQAVIAQVKHIEKLDTGLEMKRMDRRTGHIPTAAIKDYDVVITAMATAIDALWRDPVLCSQIRYLQSIKSFYSSKNPMLREIIKEHTLRNAIPQSEAVRMQEIESQGRAVHVAAQKANDWSVASGWLSDVIKNNRAIGGAIASKLDMQDPLDGMLAIWSPGFTAAQVDAYFDGLEPKLRMLQAEVLSKQKDTQPLQGPFPVEQQIELNRIICEKMGFDFSRGGLRYSANSAIEGSLRNYAFANVRTPHENNPFYMSLRSAIHEGPGHGVYHQNKPEEFEYTPLGRDAGGVMQEAQALLMEMIISRSHPACTFIAREASAVFGRTIDAEQLYALRNEITFTEDRKEADELTYHLHVIARWKAYKELFSGAVDAENFPHRLAAIYEETVGIKVDDPVRLALYDVHFFNGKGALYPSYTLGHGLGAQLYNTMRRDLPDMDARMEQGDFTQVVSWLNEKIHSKGRLYSIEQLVRNATGENPDPSYQIAHLKDRFAPAYAERQAAPALAPLTGPSGMA